MFCRLSKGIMTYLKRDFMLYGKLSAATFGQICETWFLELRAMAKINSCEVSKSSLPPKTM